MRRKINLLIIAAILGLIALSIIQGYLINNTYKLKKEVFINDIKKSVSKIDDFSPALDSLSGVWQEQFLSKLVDYKIGLVERKEVVAGLEFVIDSINEIYKSEYQKALAQTNIVFSIKFHKQLQNIILLDSVKNDTLYNIKKTDKRIVIGDAISEEDAINISSTRWETNHSSSRTVNGKQKEISFDFVLTTKDVIDIEDWKSIVLKQMSALLLLSFIIFAIVIGLLYYSIKNFITQKKIADIKTDFVNNITHELKTPLATLTLATKMLMKDDIKQQSQLLDNTLNTIDRQNRRLQKLIDQVLNNSMGYREISLQKEEIAIKPYINNALDDFMLSINEKNVTINRTFNIEKSHIEIDKFYITTALFNILENAIKYNNKPVVITCDIYTKKNLSISISDNGIGVSKKNQKQIFEKFFRAENKEIHDVKGLGLGLYYTNQIIKAHGGSLKLESKIGKGSKFTLTIPFN